MNPIWGHREIRVDEGKSEIGSLGFTVPPIDQSRPLAPSLLSVEGVVIIVLNAPGCSQEAAGRDANLEFLSAHGRYGSMIFFSRQRQKERSRRSVIVRWRIQTRSTRMAPVWLASKHATRNDCCPCPINCKIDSQDNSSSTSSITVAGVREGLPHWQVQALPHR